MAQYYLFAVQTTSTRTWWMVRKHDAPVKSTGWSWIIFATKTKCQCKGSISISRQSQICIDMPKRPLFAADVLYVSWWNGYLRCFHGGLSFGVSCPWTSFLGDDSKLNLALQVGRSFLSTRKNVMRKGDFHDMFMVILKLNVVIWWCSGDCMVIICLWWFNQ